MKTLCIISCGKTKIWNKNPKAGPTKAESAYIGNFFNKCREYATKFYSKSWCILSAKYGFVFPDELIPGPYEATFKNRKTNQITLKELSDQIIEKGLNEYQQIVIIAGKAYADIARAVFPSKKILTPLSECKRNGYMMQKLNESIKRGVPL
jgi:cytoplasmic iron level regulating protein YaaA (DUF328/UPF0246 family)